MKVCVFPAFSAVAPEDVRGTAAVVIDTLRMTSVAAEALENGCESIRVVAEPEEAMALARETGALLGGERGAVKIPGFDLDNSPLAYTREAVGGRDLVMTTSNGTRAILACAEADALFLACLRNAAAAAEAVRGYECISLVCAGTRGRFSLEDGLTAGKLIDCLPDAETDDLGAAMRGLYRAYRDRVKDLMTECAHCRKLISLGFSGDVDHCLTEDASRSVPVWKNGKFVRA